MSMSSYLPTFSVRARRRVINDPLQPQEPSFFDTHPLGEVARTLFFATLQWGLLALAVYAVYTLVLAS